jgi:hypothetical protein
MTPTDHLQVPVNAFFSNIDSYLCPCQATSDYTCLLCNLEADYDEEPDDLFDEMAESLNTIASEPLSSAWEGDGLEPIIQQILRSQGCDMELDQENIQSSFTWNKSTFKYPSELDYPIPTDEDDKEELSWCGTIDRASAECCLVATRSKTKALENSTNSQTAEPADEPTAPKPTMRWVGKYPNTPRSTQTTPADFRIATIVTPMIDDFRAIHNDQSGHFGLDFSYRKLLQRCGSKWANERGEATKIKEQLKQFLDGCPTCQKLRGLREKIKCKHSFIVSRPFL